MKEPNKFHNYETEKITRKASEWRGRIYQVVRFFHPKSSCTMHLMLFSERLLIYASSCMTISGENRTTRYILPRHWLYEWFSSAANVRRYMRRARQSWVKEPNNML